MMLAALLKLINGIKNVAPSVLASCCLVDIAFGLFVPNYISSLHLIFSVESSPGRAGGR